MAKQVADAEARARALDAGQSFIVQAPAGSGKTGLITQRFLTLLARVERPEEVLAITFTRKAAGEMRQRILEALHGARGPEPGDEHQRLTWQLARRALANDEKRGWALLENPSRLAVQTIDSFCNWLTRQLPLLSRFGAQPSLVEDGEALYREAARLTLLDLEQDRDWTPHIETLLNHLDNDLGRAEAMLVTMLARRDQWLRHVVGVGREAGPQERQALEAALGSAIEESLAALRQALPPAEVGELLELARFAACHIKDERHGLVGWRELTALPEAKVAELPRWRGLVDLLLTKGDEWRQRVAADIGFPPKSEARGEAQKSLFTSMKERHKALIETLSADETLLARLKAVRMLPDARYGDEQWQVVAALCELLMVAVGHLRLVFARRGQVDFSEVAQSALLALGEEDEPTDLALALDYRISHLLVDEFQDTSTGQFELLRRLTAGWQQGDGRTLFLVGDPMQSIYRFRQAEVGLYLQARDHGIGDVELEPLTLTVNFRSQGGVVEWVNRIFRHVLPRHSDVGSGAVAYSPADAFHEVAEGEAVTFHPMYEKDGAAEALKVVELVQEAAVRHPHGTTAILVRSRTALADIVPALKGACLRFRAIEIEQLGQRPVVQDLLSLTRALLHPADRVAWLAILRAPWCGLTLTDLERLVSGAPEATVWDLLNQPERRQALSEDGQARLQRPLAVLAEALRQRRRRPLRAWVEACWLGLGGPACVGDATDLEDAEVFFKLIDSVDESGDLTDLDQLDQRLEKLFALADVEAPEQLQLMTIHKSKGLEFDTVILPGLHKTGRADEPPLLMWLERINRKGESNLLLAPVRAVGQRENATYDYLRELDKEKGRFELGRLLYVAVTRARQRLHLLGAADFHEEKGVFRAPASGSLLALLWPQLQGAFETPAVAARESEPPRPVEQTAGARHPIRRLPRDWRLPEFFTGSGEGEPEQEAAETPESIWASETARHIGTVVHLWLQTIAEEGLARWHPQRIEAERPRYLDALQGLGVVADELAEAGQRVEAALKATLADERGRWILADHPQARCEYALSGLFEGEMINLVLDRTFVDEAGRRWIVDYKTSRCGADEDLQAFLDAEQERYRPQLERYAAFMAKMEERPIRMALYFPLVQGWREWSFESESSC